MPALEHTLRIERPAAEVYAISQDYSVRKDWDPFTRSMRFLSKKPNPEPGVQIDVEAWNGLRMRVQYVTVRPPKRAAFRMISGPRFFTNFAGTWIFSPILNGATKARFRYSFTTTWRWLRPLLDPLVRLAFSWDTRRRLVALKHYCEASA
jgi:ribosome-associated toxin RatA of RatAB toxin-antitoxin module